MVEGEGSFSPEREQDEPTIAEIVEACREELDEDALVGFEGLEDIGDVVGYAIGALFEAGIENPEDFLREKGILE